MTSPPGELMLDEYQLTMADSHVAQGTADDRVAFEMFVRRLPPHRGYLIAAGLESAIDRLADMRFHQPALEYLERQAICGARLLARLAGLRFDGDLHAVPEGSMVQAGEPLLRVEGGRMVCQLAESYILNQLNFQTLIASKAARLVGAAAGRPVVDFGFRRAHGAEAGVLAARSAYIGGCTATATVAAGFEWGIPTTGTTSHSFVMGFDHELAAFAAYLRDQPQRATLLIDTYDTLVGARNAILASRETGVPLQAVRLDSGDVDTLSRGVRALLDEAGLATTRILCSGDLDEYEIERLVGRGAPIDGFGVGTQLVTGGDVAALGGVYKLVESAGRPVMKTSLNKASLPGRHQVFRSPEGDVIGLADEDLPGRRLLEPVVKAGVRELPAPSLDEIRDRAAAELAALPEASRRLRDPATVPTALSPRLAALKEALS
ncbi:MAG: nicotinate phosphoribosyltransferase [Gaiellales bacterium]|jgi:nicotinate phosphoribosyltransferase|nr:nicotinate phosphoribosyltransferase [Gaiellales bacterium]